MVQSSASSSSATATASQEKPMSCAKCQDVLTTVPDSAAKGGSRLLAQGEPTKTVVSHLCEGCVTTTATTGAGKQLKNVVLHKCASCGSETATCCNTTKGGDVATKGMEK